MREPRDARHDLLSFVLAGNPLALGLGPILIVCAHPDDETLFASAVLMRHPQDVFVLHLTDGAPEDPRARPFGWPDRAAYAAERQRELIAAFDTLGLPTHQRAYFGIVDQCLVFRLATVVPKLCLLLQEQRPSIVFTHAYEGGHPDHDAASLAVKLALAQARALGVRPPVLAEFAGYHAGHLAGHHVADHAAHHARAQHRDAMPTLIPLQFDRTRHPHAQVSTVSLTMRERHLKRGALACFASQTAVIQQFPVDAERYRLAPAYDYTQPPSDSVMYEQWWGHWMDARRWCRVAAPALGGLARSPVHAHDRQRRLSARAGRP